jgi:hypothetical protein
MHSGRELIGDLPITEIKMETLMEQIDRLFRI